MRVRPRLAMILLASASALAGCVGAAPDDSGNGTPSGPADNGNDNGDDGTPDPGGPVDPGLAALLTAMGHSDCDDAFACKASFPSDAGGTFADAFGASATACYADSAGYYDPSTIQAQITAGKIMFNSSAAAMCVSGLAAAAPPICSTYWTMGPSQPAGCATALVGTVASGGACVTDFECTGELYCDDTSKCTAAPSGARLQTDDRGLSMHPKLAHALR